MNRSPVNRSPVKRRLLVALKVGVICLLLAYMARSVMHLDLASLKAAATGWPWLLLAQVFIGLFLVLSFYRWQLLLTAQGIHYRLGEALALGFIGFFFNQFVAGSTGGDVVKAYYVAVDHPERRAAGITTVFLDRVVGLLVLVGIAAAAIAVNWPRIAADPNLRLFSALVGGILLGFGAAGALFFSARVRANRAVRVALAWLPFRDLLGKIQAAVYVYRFRLPLMAAALALSLVIQSSVVGMVYCYALALGWDAGLDSFLFVVPLAHLALAVPTGSPGGLGQSEFAYQYLFSRFGLSDGLILGLLERVNLCLWGLVGCAFYARRRGRVRKAIELAREEERLASGDDPPGPGEAARLAPAGPERGAYRAAEP